MSSKSPTKRASGTALRIACVCLAIVASASAAALAAEPTSEAAVQAATELVAAKHSPAKDWLGTAMNAGAIVFCISMVALLWRPGLGRSLMLDKRTHRRKRR